MPYKAPHNCKHGRCPNLVPSGQSYCLDHQGIHKTDFKRRHPERQKMYGANWQAYRTMYLAEHPLCINYENDCHMSASVVDHIRDHHGDYVLFWDVSNHQPMCAACHNKKTAKESGWGKQNE